MARQGWVLTAGPVMGLLLLAMSALADEAAALKKIENLRGSVQVDEKLPGRPVVSVALQTTDVTDADLKELKALKSLQELDLNNTNVTDSGLKELGELKNLRELSLHDTSVTAAGITELQAALPNLRIRSDFRGDPGVLGR